MVSVAQLAEHWVVAPAVAGSNPVTHPIKDSMLVPFYQYPLQDLHNSFIRHSPA
jgi:hypothetical protein